MFVGSLKLWLFDYVLVSLYCGRKRKSSFLCNRSVHFWRLSLLVPVEDVSSCLFVGWSAWCEVASLLRLGLRFRWSLNIFKIFLLNVICKLLLKVPKRFPSHVFCVLLNWLLINWSLQISLHIRVSWSLTMLFYLLKYNLNDIIGPFQIVSTVRNYQFFNKLGFGFVNSVYNLLWMITIDYLIIQRVNKNDGNDGF
jgi:hypothetical protein